MTFGFTVLTAADKSKVRNAFDTAITNVKLKVAKLNDIDMKERKVATAHSLFCLSCVLLSSLDLLPVS